MRTLKTALLTATIAFAATAANASTTDLTTIGAEVRDGAGVTIVDLTQTQPVLEMNKPQVIDAKDKSPKTPKSPTLSIGQK